MVVPEALAAGLPVVATNQVISAHEFIKNEINGLIIPSEDVSALAEKMAYFIRHPEVIPTDVNRSPKVTRQLQSRNWRREISSISFKCNEFKSNGCRNKSNDTFPD
jgi:glycosyltransferase involved in cell wall biosynthesis